MFSLGQLAVLRGLASLGELDSVFMHLKETVVLFESSCSHMPSVRILQRFSACHMPTSSYS